MQCGWGHWDGDSLPRYRTASLLPTAQEACNRHRTAPTASAALGRALMGTLLLASFRGEGERTQVREPVGQP